MSIFKDKVPFPYYYYFLLTVDN